MLTVECFEMRIWVFWMEHESQISPMELWGALRIIGETIMGEELSSSSAGTPEVGGLTVIQGLEILRGCQGMNVVGGDVVEVSDILTSCSSLVFRMFSNATHDSLRFE